MEYLILISIVISGCGMIILVAYLKFRKLLVSRIIYLVMPGVGVIFILGYIYARMGLSINSLLVVLPVGLTTWFIILFLFNKQVAKPLAVITGIIKTE